jgi:hypothetical protein
MLKHVGRLVKSDVKVLVVFRTLPGESDQALVIPVASLSDGYHDDIMKLVETQQAQDCFEFGEILFTRKFSDGRPMLSALRADNTLQKVSTDRVVMTPTTKDIIPLTDLNILVAEQKNCAVDELYTFVSGAPRKTDATVEEIVKVTNLGRDLGEPSNVPAPVAAAAPDAVLDDTSIAKSYRSQADALYKEAARLRKEAEELDPAPKTKRTSKKTAKQEAE